MTAHTGFYSFLSVTEVIEFSLETITIIYDCLSSEGTWTVKGSPVWLYISARPIKADAAAALNTSRSPVGGILNLLSVLFCIKIDCLRLESVRERK